MICTSHKAKISWGVVYLLKSEGGLGLRPLKDKQSEWSQAHMEVTCSKNVTLGVMDQTISYDAKTFLDYKSITKTGLVDVEKDPQAKRDNKRVSKDENTKWKEHFLLV